MTPTIESVAATAWPVTVVVPPKHRSGVLPTPFQAAVGRVANECCRATLVREVVPITSKRTIGCLAIKIGQYWPAGINYASACRVLQKDHRMALCQKEIALATEISEGVGLFTGECVSVAMSPILCRTCHTEMFFHLGYRDGGLRVVPLSNQRISIPPTASILFARPALS